MNRSKYCHLMMVLLLCVSRFVFADALSPAGYWQTIDDVTGKPKSILHIYEQQGELAGKIVKIFPRPGFDQNELCTACTGPLHNQPMVGMVILNGLRQAPTELNEWNDGHILDPMNGKRYRCYATLVGDGNKLNVRGYVGIALFGRSQTWVRVTA